MILDGLSTRKRPTTCGVGGRRVFLVRVPATKRPRPALPRLIDAHCHLYLFDRPREVARRAQSRGVVTVAVSAEPSEYRGLLETVGESQWILPAVGLHPGLAGERGRALAELLEVLPSVRFVGEVGLDYFFATSETRRVQRRVFSRIVEACDQIGGKILSVHSRRAAADVINTIGSSFNGKVILHWYLDSMRELDRAVEFGSFFSVNEAMFKSERGRRLLTRIPVARVLTETDGPFVRAGQRPLEPRDISRVVGRLAKLWGTKPAEAAHLVKQNLAGLLGR